MKFWEWSDPLNQSYGSLTLIISTLKLAFKSQGGADSAPPIETPLKVAVGGYVKYGMDIWYLWAYIPNFS